VSSFANRVISAITGLVNPLTGATLPRGFMNLILAGMVFMRVIGALIFWVIIAGIAHLVARYIFRGPRLARANRKPSSLSVIATGN